MRLVALYKCYMLLPLPTERQHSHVQVAGHFAAERLLDRTVRHLLVLSEHGAQLRMTVGAQDLVELGLVCAPPSLASLIQFLHHRPQRHHATTRLTVHNN